MILSLWSSKPKMCFWGKVNEKDLMLTGFITMYFWRSLKLILSSSVLTAESLKQCCVWTVILKGSISNIVVATHENSFHLSFESALLTKIFEGINRPRHSTAHFRRHLFLSEVAYLFIGGHDRNEIYAPNVDRVSLEFTFAWPRVGKDLGLG